MKESQEAIAFIKWAQYHPICKNHLIAIPNGGSRNIIEAQNLKLQGVKPGVSDYFLAYPTKRYAGLWVELKRRLPFSSVVSDAQHQWQMLMLEHGYDARIAYGWEEAVMAVKIYLGRKNGK